jgi:hypothetical protein
MITKEDKELILMLFKQVDVKKMDIDHPDENLVKWFRFGSYNGMQVACEIIKNIPEEKSIKKKNNESPKEKESV